MKLRHSSQKNIVVVTHIMVILFDYGRQKWEEIRANLVFMGINFKSRSSNEVTD